MNDAASFDAILQCNLLEVFCEALGAAIFVTDKFDEISFASIRLLHLFPIRESAIASGSRARDLYGALYDSGLRFGSEARDVARREDWIAERTACSWKERIDRVEQVGPERWIRIVSRRFSSGLGFVVIQDVSEQKKKELLLRNEQERVKLTEDILDTLPVAIAVKDRNLNYVAVNQEFCRLIGKPEEAILGHGTWNALSPELAGRIEQLDWQLLSSGEPGLAHITHVRPDGQSFALERRAQRLGKPGSHYIAVSIVQDGDRRSEGGLPIHAPGSTPEAARPQTAPSDIAASLRNVLLLTETRRQDQALKLALRAHGADLCIIRDVPEFAAFLPAAVDAGLTIDLVLIDFEFDAAAFNVAAAANLNFRMLPASADESTIMADVLHVLALPRLPLEPPSIEPPALPVADMAQRTVDAPEPDASRLDILCVEDNPINRMVLEQMLGSMAVSFRIAATAAEGLADFARARPRLLLADTTLPDMSAADFVLKIRHLDPAATIVALVTADSTDMHRKAAAAGFDHTLAKPLSAEVLGKLVPEWLESASLVPADRQHES